MKKKQELQPSYSEVKKLIKDNIKTMAESFIAVGYYLKIIRDGNLYLEDGFSSIWDFAKDTYNISKSTASRYMEMCDRFSVGGDSPVLAEEFADFGKSQLQEMISLKGKKPEGINPDMTVKEIREEVKPKQKVVATSQQEEAPDKESECPPNISGCIRQEWGTGRGEQKAGQKECEKCWQEWRKNDKIAGYMKKEEEEPLSVMGLPKTVYEENSSMTTVGCGHKYDCFCCHRVCELRQEKCLCVESVSGKNSFGCTTLNMLENLKKEIGDICQFVNTDLAYHRAGDKEPVPCCRDCTQRCGYACQRANIKEGEQEAIKVKCTDAQETTFESGYYDVNFFLREEQGKLDEINALEGLPAIMTQRAKTIVSALSLMAEMQEDLGYDSNRQPELPVLKNKEQREVFIDNYKNWPVWIHTIETGETYYRYNLPDGTSIVIRQWTEKSDWNNTEHDRTEKFLLREGKYFRDCETSTTVLIDHLKDVQKTNN